MNNKKVFGILSLVLASVLVCGTALAETTQTAPQAPAQYTDAQKACIKTAQDKRMATMKPAADTLKNQTEAALKARQEALVAAQKIEDVKKRVAAIKAANDAYNNDPTVKKVKTPYATAVKAANDQFQIDQKACLSASGKNPKGFFKKMGDGFLNFGNAVGNFFTGKKNK